MKLDRWIRRLLPRKDKFLSFFVEDIQNIADASRVLRQLLLAKGSEERSRMVREIEELEHRGDELTHTIFKELRLTFITSLDREDIGTLASSLDDILDNIDRAATSIELYRITDFDPAVVDLVAIIEQSVSELGVAIPLLRDMDDPEPIRQSCVRVNAFENQADQVFHRALARLFQEEKDPIQLIKKKELIAVLESATDRCEDAAVLIENVLVKMS